jgi:hypothetical protein
VITGLQIGLDALNDLIAHHLDFVFIDPVSIKEIRSGNEFVDERKIDEKKNDDDGKNDCPTWNLISSYRCFLAKPFHNFFLPASSCEPTRTLHGFPPVPATESARRHLSRRRSRASLRSMAFFAARVGSMESRSSL